MLFFSASPTLSVNTVTHSITRGVLAEDVEPLLAIYVESHIHKDFASVALFGEVGLDLVSSVILIGAVNDSLIYIRVLSTRLLNFSCSSTNSNIFHYIFSFSLHLRHSSLNASSALQ